MRLLLDTHVFLWMRREPKRLSRRVAALLKSPSEDLYVSVGTGWEIATKVRIGKLVFDPTFLDDFAMRVRAMGINPLGITASHAISGALLPGKHKDPFDRLLAAQAKLEHLTLVSADPAFKELSIQTFW
ncbi:MAG: type II toxin-antitoxin system VapC family toxin [Hyphomicrobium sp.]